MASTVGDSAQAVDAGKLAAGHREAPRLAADAQQKLVVVEFAAVAEPQALRAAVEGRHAHAESRLNPVLLVELGAAQPEPLPLQLAGQVLLGQGGRLYGR